MCQKTPLTSPFCSLASGAVPAYSCVVAPKLAGNRNNLCFKSHQKTYHTLAEVRTLIVLENEVSPPIWR